MGEVYRRASTVFACVGPHADDSDLLFNFIHSLDLVEFSRIFKHVNAGYEPPSEAARKHEVLRLSLLYQDNPDPDLGTLNPIFDAFGQRAYWQRLWVMQEIFLSRTTIVLCGNSSASLTTLADIWDTVRWYKASRDMQGTRYPSSDLCLPTIIEVTHRLKQRHRTDMSLVDALNLPMTLLCDDRRDYVYGIGAVVRWPSGSTPLQPDYTINTSDLF